MNTGVFSSEVRRLVPWTILGRDWSIQTNRNSLFSLGGMAGSKLGYPAFLDRPFLTVCQTSQQQRHTTTLVQTTSLLLPELDVIVHLQRKRDQREKHTVRNNNISNIMS